MADELYDEYYDDVGKLNYYENFLHNSYGPLNENSFSRLAEDDIDEAVFVQSINENIYLKKNTTLKVYIKTYNQKLELAGSRELKIDIDLAKSSWGATFINPL